MTWGITKSLASNAAILNLLIPVITAVLASFMLRERITLLRVVCLLVGLAGVFLLSVQDLKQSSFLQSNYLAGNLLILAGCLGSAFYNVYCKGPCSSGFRKSRSSSSAMSRPRSPACRCSSGSSRSTWTQLAALDWRGWLAFAFLAIFMYGLSMLLFFYVLQHLPVTVASASLYLVPVFGILLAASFLGERLTPVAIAGTSVVLLSTIAIMRWDKSAV